ncbi:MAG TPA: prenyltransferase/squalene oxidase repeat-containing protein, partial [Chthonomonadales bacterium]|nr:prenyltransferase/squalene oxidase repeat-containing protein [Chthonomonadales bacterium]
MKSKEQLETLDVPEYAITHAHHPSHSEVASKIAVEEAIARARDWLLAMQHEDGHWVGELEGDTILETEYVLLLQFLGNPDRDKLRKLCNYVIRRWQNEEGGIPIYPGGPSD